MIYMTKTILSEPENIGEGELQQLRKQETSKFANAQQRLAMSIQVCMVINLKTTKFTSKMNAKRESTPTLMITFFQKHAQTCEINEFYTFVIGSARSQEF